MKRTLFLLIAAIGIVTISAGCSSGDTRVLESKISQLEQQLNSQNAANSSSSTANSANTSSQNNDVNTGTSSPASSSAPSAPAQNNNTNTQQPNTNFDISALSQKVESVVQLADSTQPKATYGENYNLYGQVKMQIKQVDYELERFEDQIEMALRTGALSYDQYYQLDRTLDQLDHRLDMAEDSLEWRLGVDD